MGMERKVLIIDGMTCINCQNKIEQELKNTAGISKVQVSYSKGQAEIEFNPEIVTLNRIAAIIEKLDYTVIDKKQADSLKWVRRIGTLAVIILLYYLLQHFGILNLLVPSMLADSQMSYGMLFIVGLLTSVHCIAMCGGIHLSQCIPSRNAENTSSSRINVIMPSVLYNAGRVVSYTAVGFVLGGAGMILTGGSGSGMPLLLQGILKITAGLFMVIMGINMLGIFPALRKLQIRFPRKSVIKINQKKRTEKRPFVVGLLNGLMPCGPMQSMQIIALGSGNPISGALAMLMFSLGTVPLMLGLGSLVSALGEKYTKLVMQTGAILVVVLGLAMLSQGAGLAGIRLDRISQVSDGAKELDTAVIAQSGDIQYVESNLDFGTYPEITVYTGIPVKWTINVPEDVINGCNYKMIVKTYGITHEFTPGTEDKSAGSKNTAAQSTASTENAAAASYITPAVENGQLAIDIGTLTEHPLYVNYDSNGTNIQMIAVNASDGSARLSLNTCQTCNPSPKAYFKERSGKLVCQNCGNVFKMDSVGGTVGGCNPMNIQYTVADGKITVNTADLDSHAKQFSSWSGPVE